MTKEDFIANMDNFVELLQDPEVVAALSLRIGFYFDRMTNGSYPEQQLLEVLSDKILLALIDRIQGISIYSSNRSVFLRAMEAMLDKVQDDYTIHSCILRLLERPYISQKIEEICSQGAVVDFVDLQTRAASLKEEISRLEGKLDSIKSGIANYSAFANQAI